MRLSAASIARDDLDIRTAREPGLNGRNFSIGEKRHGGVVTALAACWRFECGVAEEHDENQLFRISVPSGDHSPGDLALSPARAETGLVKLFDGHPEEIESHELEALRISPHDTEAGIWVAYIAIAKLYLGAYEEALGFLRRDNQDENRATIRMRMCRRGGDEGRA